MKTLALVLAFIGLSPAFAAQYTCTFSSDHLKWEGKPITVRANIKTGWWGSYYIKSGSFRYDTGDITVSGELDCSTYEHKNQICKPSAEDAVLESIITHPIMGMFVQVRGQAPIGPMDCK